MDTGLSAEEFRNSEQNAVKVIVTERKAVAEAAVKAASALLESVKAVGKLRSTSAATRQMQVQASVASGSGSDDDAEEEEVDEEEE